MKPKIRFLVDEDAPAAVSKFLKEQGHDVTHVVYVDELRGTPDHVLAALADDQGSVVLTWNYRDYKDILNRRAGGGSSRHRRASAVSFKCSHPDGRRRIEDALELIEFEWNRAITSHDRRIFIEVHKDLIRVHR